MTRSTLASGALPENEPAARPRLPWIDAAKAFAILCVVFGHVLRGAWDGGLIGDDRLFRMTDNAIYLFHMPLFFFLSGLTFSGAAQPWPIFLRRLTRSIVLPYVIWSVALVAVKMLAAAHVNHPVGLSDLLAIAYAPVSPFWFFYALFLIQIAARIMVPRFGVAGCLALAGLAFVTHFLNPDRGTALDFAFEFFLYFALGLVFRPLRERFPRAGVGAGLAAALVFFLVMLLCLVWWIDYFSLLGRLAAIPMVLAASVFFLWFGTTPPGRSGVVQLTGRATLAIYCLHIFFTGTTRAALLDLGIAAPGPQLLSGTVLGLVAPILIQFAATRLGLVAWLGLPPLTPPGPGSRGARERV